MFMVASNFRSCDFRAAPSVRKNFRFVQNGLRQHFEQKFLRNQIKPIRLPDKIKQLIARMARLQNRFGGGGLVCPNAFW
jgi:hypothetical protein